jgi:hypothetical protein
MNLLTLRHSQKLAPMRDGNRLFALTTGGATYPALP